MDVRELIESGLLELYITGGLTDAERHMVESMRHHEEVARELESIERALESYATLHARRPKRDLLPGIKKSLEHPGATDIRRNPVRKLVVTMPRWAAIAASLILVASATLAAFSYMNWRKEVAKTKQQEARLAELEGDMDDMGVSMELMKRDMLMIADESTARVTLKGTEMTPDARAMVFWNAEEAAVYFNAITLSATDSSHQYQLWALKDGQPIDAGVFDMSRDMMRLKDVGSADAFAVTIEPRGGSVSPTLDQMVLIGEV